MFIHILFQASLNGHVNWVKTAKFSSDGRLVGSGSDDKSLKLWDIASKECIHTFFEHSGFINDVSWSIILLIGNICNIQVYKFSFYNVLTSFPYLSGWVPP